MKFVLGRKLQMTQLFDENGIVRPVTVVALEPLEVSLCRTDTRDGYEAVQVQYGDDKQRRKEFRGAVTTHEVGKSIDSAEVFSPGDVVRVSARSKGKGFQGVVKRYGFAGGPRTHGQKHNERSPGSIGSGLRNRVPKGTKMGGRMGDNRVTIRGTQVVSVDKERGLLLLHGSIPGRRGTLVEIQGV
ncbi:MAG: 50S ribosomal protein L3 [Candidatus Kaiserbacteria bacterium]|nr:50S ribosomal protein L3 [Candidatus Kaiserbacteria bacterium]